MKVFNRRGPQFKTRDMSLWLFFWDGGVIQKFQCLSKYLKIPDFHMKLLGVHGAPNEGFVCHLLNPHKTSKSRQHCRQKPPTDL